LEHEDFSHAVGLITCCAERMKTHAFSVLGTSDSWVILHSIWAMVRGQARF
jgi:hypothetical protein